jgi:hypothetical protein
LALNLRSGTGARIESVKVCGAGLIARAILFNALIRSVGSGHFETKNPSLMEQWQR